MINYKLIIKDIQKSNIYKILNFINFLIAFCISLIFAKVIDSEICKATISLFTNSYILYLLILPLSFVIGTLVVSYIKNNYLIITRLKNKKEYYKVCITSMVYLITKMYIKMLAYMSICIVLFNHNNVYIDFSKFINFSIILTRVYLGIILLNLTNLLLTTLSISNKIIYQLQVLNLAFMITSKSLCSNLLLASHMSNLGMYNSISDMILYDILFYLITYTLVFAGMLLAYKKIDIKEDEDYF